MKIISKDGRIEELDNAFYVNPDGWFRDTYSLAIPSGNFCQTFVIEAGSERDAIDEFLDSKFGGNIKVSQEDLNDAVQAFLLGEGFSLEEIQSVDSPWDVVHENNLHEGLYAYLEEDCSFAQGGNGGEWYHSDLLLVGCLNRVKVEDYPYENKDYPYENEGEE